MNKYPNVTLIERARWGIAKILFWVAVLVIPPRFAEMAKKETLKALAARKGLEVVEVIDEGECRTRK